MFTFDHIWKDWPWPLTVNALFTAFFFALVAVTVSALVILRSYKIKRERQKKQYQDQIDSFLNNGLFDEEFDMSSESQKFKNLFLISPLQKKIAIRQILIYNENLKGESSEALKKIFHELSLDYFTLNALKNGQWFDKAKAIYTLSELHVKEGKEVARYLNDKHESVRAQAIYYFIKTAEQDPLAFFARLKKELTLWELIQIEDCIKSVYKGPIPDFSVWLKHHLNTILIFSIRMIQQFDQYENIEAIVPFLSHSHEKVRAEAVNSLRKLQYEELLAIVIPRFSEEHKLVKKEIIKAVETLGDLGQLQELNPNLSSKDEWQTNLLYLRAEKRMQLQPEA